MNPTPLVPGSRVLDRRQWLGGASLLGISTLLRKSFLSKSFLSSSLPAPNPTTLWTPPKNFTSGPACTLTLAQTEGPYYVNPALLRQDITEGRSGFPLQLSITVVRASTCAPIQNAIVDIWHCDENGLYSGFSGQLGGLDTQGDNFYRGIQVTDANGVATFRTIYPGYYPGRTVHIHFKVWQNGTQSLTSQLYFDDKLTDEIFAAAEPYNGRAARTTRNTNDGIYNAALVVAATPHQGGVASAFTVVVA